jgi:hypothetical protein
MSGKSLAVACLLLTGWGCTSSVRLSPADRDRAAAAERIPVVFTVSSAPWVDCPGDEGRMLWEWPGSRLESPYPAPWIQADLSGPPPRELGAAGWIVPAGDIWEDYMDEWSKALQTPPEDPARATGRRFLAGVSPGSLPLAAEPEEVPSADPGSLSARFGPKPVLVFHATRWVLVGCFFTFRPWFDVRATLLDLPSGRVLWRAECGGAYPPSALPRAGPAALDANGRALYRQVIEARASECSTELLGSFGSGPPGSSASATR